MTIGIVAGVFVALVIWWLQELDREFDREKVDEKIREEREAFKAHIRPLNWELEKGLSLSEIRADFRREQLNEVIQLSNQEIDRLNRIYA